MNVIGSNTAMQAIEYALLGLDRRRNVIANNVANAQTPGFRASAVDFETSLQLAIERDAIDDPGPVTITTRLDPVIVNGNNVRVELELVEMIRTNLLQDILVNTYNSKLDMIRTAIGAR